MFTISEEKARVAALKQLNILNTPKDNTFDNIVALAAQVCDTPVAYISLIDESRQWFKSVIGLTINECPRNLSICQYTIQQNDIFEIQNAHKNSHFKANDYVTGAPHICFYAGIPLTSTEGFNLGTLCVIDHKPRRLIAKQREALTMLAEQCNALMVANEYQNKIGQLNYVLEEKMHLLNKITQDMPAIVAYWNADQTCLFANKTCLERMQKSEEDVIGHHYDELIPPKVAECSKQFLLRALNGDSCECEFNHRQGEENSQNNIFHAQYTSDIDDNGHILGVLVLIIDITHIRKIEDNQKLFSRIIEHSSDAILITDEHFKIESVNPAFEKLTQYSIDEIASITPSFLFAFREQKQSFEQIQQTLKVKNNWSGELWQAKKNGEHFYALLSIDVIKDMGQNPIHYTFSMRDQTQNEKMRADLSIMTDMLNRTGAMAKVGGWELNLISEKLLWTDEVFNIHELAKTSEPSLEEAITYYPPEACPALKQVIDDCIQTGKTWDLELPFVTAKQKNLWVRTTGSRISFNNKAFKLTGTIQDVTERKEAEIQRAQDEIKHRNALVREVHHRIKNNLQGVSGILSNYAEQNPTASSIFNEASAKLKSVAITYGLEGQGPDASIELGELSFAIKRNIEWLWQTEIEFSLPDKWPKTHIEKNESVPIALILNELITNAAKHQTDKNSIKVKLEHIKSDSNSQLIIRDKALITVSNQGEYLSEKSPDMMKNPKNQSGLGLMSALMPKRGAYIQWNIEENLVNVSLELSFPVIIYPKKQ